jgi:hypothetical protein
MNCHEPPPRHRYVGRRSVPRVDATISRLAEDGLVPDQEVDDPERRWDRAKVIATIADVAVRLADLILRR